VSSASLAQRLSSNPVRRWLRSRGWLIVGLLAGLWSLVVGWLAVSRYLAFNTGYDLGVFAQVVWATTQGRPFFTSMVEGTTNFLAHHFTPLLAILVPFYSIWPDARLLLIFQTVALAAGAIPLYAFARRRLGPGMALLTVLAYFLFPPLHSVALFDFHAIALAVPLLMAAGVALIDERPRATVIWLALALLAKEEVAVIAVGFGLYALLIQRRRRFGAALTTGAGVWALLLFSWIMPSLGQTLVGYPFVYRYRTLGETPGQVIRTLFTRPGTIVHVLATRDKARFLWQLLAPLAGLPLLGWPVVLLSLPILAYLLLSDWSFMSSTRYHYTAPVIPFLFLASVVALQRLGARGPRYRLVGAAVLLLSALVSAWWWSPLPGGGSYEPATFAITEEAHARRDLLEMIPADAAIAADWAYLPWLANRWQLDTLLSLPYPLAAADAPPDFLLTQMPGPGATSAPLYPWVVQARSGQTLRVPRFAPNSTTPGGLVLWKARGHEYDVLLTRFDVAFEQGLTLVGAGLPPEFESWGAVISVEPGTTLPVWMAWAAQRPLEQRITFTLHLVDRSGKLVTQIDQEMGQGRFPITLWHDWLQTPVVADEFDLPIPSDLPPGRYRLLVGAYDSETVALLAQLNGGSWFELALVEVIQ
jgi:uncharacterized membrane protein